MAVTEPRPSAPTAPAPRPRRRRRLLLALVAVTVALGLALAAVPVLRAVVHREGPLGNLDIPGAGQPGPWPARAPSTAARSGPPYATTVSADGRTFLDQYGHPYLMRGDAPWSVLTRLSPTGLRTYLRVRSRLGFNTMIVSLVGSVGNGGPSDDGATYDGLRPFVAGDTTRLSPAYLARVHAYLALAARAGFTVLLYPVDAWMLGHAFSPTSVDQCATYGRQVATALADLPDIVWLSGGDYLPHDLGPAGGSPVDDCLTAMVRGIRSTGDTRPFSVQIGYDGAFTTQDSSRYWATRVDYDLVYTYDPTYRAVLQAYDSPRTTPVVMGEANYERENDQAGTPPTTLETLRRQVLWSLTSGAAGEVYGSSDWTFPPGWQSRPASPGAVQAGRLGRLVAALPWWRLVPDQDHRLLTGGVGTPVAAGQRLDVLQNDHATAALTPDGTLGLVYVPTARTITLDLSRLAPGAHATWIDPASGRRIPVPLTTSYTTPGANSDGDHDWLLELRS